MPATISPRKGAVGGMAPSYGRVGGWAPSSERRVGAGQARDR